MNTRRLLIASFVLLALGVYLLCAFCNGSTGFSASYPFSGSSLKIDITTNGLPALAGLPLTVLGLLLLVIAFLAAIVGEIRAPRTRKTVVEPVHTSDRSLP